MPGITISAAYGLAGAAVATKVADDLAMPLLDRAISAQVASALHVTVEEAEAGCPHRSFTERFFAVLSPLASGVLGAGTDAAPQEPAPDPADDFRQQSEQIIRQAALKGAVILGRGGSAALRDEPDVLRVRLFGPVEARLKQAMSTLGIDEATARQQMHEVDTAREHYVRRLYKVDANDPALFQLQLDSTALPFDSCADLIVRGYRALLGQV